ncbi:MAG TPA: hypothetical protein VFW38_10015 [Solirubrobacteraceae bacterium]|nr:hypothetical protein [Solirubrobacteraceae bacterium]
MRPERRRFVLDEDINWQLSQELQRRGRPDATGVVPQRIHGLKDGALFKALARDYEPYVLVTWDNKMPVVHAAALSHHGVPLAVLDERWLKRSGRPGSQQEPYIRDVIHRWLHRIELLSPGERRFFSPHGSRPVSLTRVAVPV